VDLYPELNLVPENFPSNQWKTATESPEIQREFFNELAKELNFDPLNASRWYKVTLNDVLKKQGSRRILQLHNNSHIEVFSDVLL